MPTPADPRPDPLPGTLPRSVRTPDGATLHYSLRPGAGPREGDEGGDRGGDGRVLLLHALGMDRGNWARVIPALPAGPSVAALDIRGHGASTRGGRGLDLTSAVDDIGRVLADLGWPSAVLAGCSMGGCIALAAATRQPRIVAGLALIDTTAWYGDGAAAAWQARADIARNRGFKALLEFQRARWFSPDFLDARPDILAGCVDVFLRNDPDTYGQACAMLGAVDFRAALPAIAAPTAIVVGAEDYATPPQMARALQAGIPGATLDILPDCRHFTPLQAPAPVAAAIAAVLARTPAAGPGRTQDPAR